MVKVMCALLEAYGDKVETQSKNATKREKERGSREVPG